MYDIMKSPLNLSVVLADEDNKKGFVRKFVPARGFLRDQINTQSAMLFVILLSTPMLATAKDNAYWATLPTTTDSQEDLTVTSDYFTDYYLPVCLSLKDIIYVYKLLSGERRESDPEQTMETFEQGIQYQMEIMSDGGMRANFQYRF